MPLPKPSQHIVVRFIAFQHLPEAVKGFRLAIDQNMLRCLEFFFCGDLVDFHDMFNRTKQVENHLTRSQVNASSKSNVFALSCVGIA